MKEGKEGVKLNDMLSRLPNDRRAKVEARAAELIAEEMSLRDLRKALGKTQVAVAKKLGMKQESVSRVEKRADVLISTLDGYLRALGGSLRLVAAGAGGADWIRRDQTSARRPKVATYVARPRSHSSERRCIALS